jgi:cytidylate kinase
MYRAAALLSSRSGIPLDNGVRIASMLEDHAFDIDGHLTLIDGEDVSDQIRTALVASEASRISAFPEVRRFMVRRQRELGALRDTVAEGRDMGTVVFPEAVLKIYVLADFAVRFQRRVLELIDDIDVPETASLIGQMLTRDMRDRNRKDSPLRPASDAVWLDTSQMSVGEQVTTVVQLFRQRVVQS